MAFPSERDLDAWLYGLLHRGTAGDVERYVAVCEGARTVLELGCGAGRVGVALARVARRVVGLELDPGRARFARERFRGDPAAASRATVVRGDMRRFAFRERFDRIVIPYNGLFAIGGDAAVRDCLAHVAAHLAPGGSIALDVYAVDDADVAPGPVVEGVGEHLVTIEHDGAVVRVYERDRWDREARSIAAHYTFHVDAGGRRLVRTHVLEHHYLSADAIAARIEEAGLRPDFRAFGPDARGLWFEGRWP